MVKITMEELEKIFPQVKMVNDPTIRNGILQIWQEFFEKSVWEDIEKPGFVSVCPDYSLTVHTNYVTDMAISVAKETEKKLGLPIDWDVLLASCLLHDVSKLAETEPCEGGFKKNKQGELYQHGFLAAFAAHQHGLPEEVISNLITHTGNSKVLPTNIEGILLYYVDMIDTDIHYFGIGKQMYIALQK